MITVLPYSIFRSTPDVLFADITVIESNFRDLVQHGPGAVSPPDVDGLHSFYYHSNQDDYLLVSQGSREFTLINYSWKNPVERITITTESGILWIPRYTFHRTVSGPEGSTVFNQGVRDPGISVVSQFEPVLMTELEPAILSIYKREYYNNERL